MATYSLTSQWSNPISVSAGAIVQNKGSGTLLVTSAATPTDADALELPQHQALRTESAVTLRARAFGKFGKLGIIEGL